MKVQEGSRRITGIWHCLSECKLWVFSLTLLQKLLQKLVLNFSRHTPGKGLLLDKLLCKSFQTIWSKNQSAIWWSPGILYIYQAIYIHCSLTCGRVWEWSGEHLGGTWSEYFSWWFPVPKLFLCHSAPLPRCVNAVWEFEFGQLKWINIWRNFPIWWVGLNAVRRKKRGVTKSSQWMKAEMKVRCMDVSKFRRVIIKWN